MAARIDSLSLPRTGERTSIEVDFTYSADKQPIEALAVEAQTPLGTVRALLPASTARIEGRRGAGRFTMDLRCLPRGTSELTLTPVLANGDRGGSASGKLIVPGAKGGAPRLHGLELVDARLRRPRGEDHVFARMTV